MADPLQPSIPLQAGAASAFDAGSAHLVQEDRSTDIELGFECANPWLQIESWAQDASGKPGYFS